MAYQSIVLWNRHAVNNKAMDSTRRNIVVSDLSATFEPEPQEAFVASRWHDTAAEARSEASTLYSRERYQDDYSEKSEFRLGIF